MEPQQVLKLMPLMFLVFFAVSIVYMVISVKRLNNYLSQSNPDRWREITSINDTFPRVKNYLLYVFGKLDNEDTKIASMKMAAKQSILYTISNFGAFLVTVLMSQVIPDEIFTKK